MRLVFSLIVVLFSTLGSSQKAQAFGDFVYMPTYTFDAKKFNPIRFGLYVDEPISGKWSYSSWTGSGRAYPNNATLEVKWYTTQQDVLYQLHELVKVGAGGGYSISTPGTNSQFDAHAVFSVRMW